MKACWRVLSDQLATARCLHNLANVVKVRGDYARARWALDEAAQAPVLHTERHRQHDEARRLTARLMPIPGKKAGDETNFSFAFFAPSRVMELGSERLSHAFSGTETIPLSTRK